MTVGRTFMETRTEKWRNKREQIRLEAEYEKLAEAFNCLRQQVKEILKEDKEIFDETDRR